jgi:hypothetical protein
MRAADCPMEYWPAGRSAEREKAPNIDRSGLHNCRWSGTIYRKE